LSYEDQKERAGEIVSKLDFEFHSDWDIGEMHAFSEELTEDEMAVVFAEEVEKIIPLEHRSKVKYICKPVLYPTPLTPPFRGGWYYPGRELSKVKS